MKPRSFDLWWDIGPILMYFWLIDPLCCRGLQRMWTIWSCLVLHNNRDCEIFVHTSVGSGSLFELGTFKQRYPEAFFVLEQAKWKKWQNSIAAAILIKRVGGPGWRRLDNLSWMGAENMTDVGWTQSWSFEKSKYDEPETLDFSCIVLGLQHSKCESLRFHAAEIPPLPSLFLSGLWISSVSLVRHQIHHRMMMASRHLFSNVADR